MHGSDRVPDLKTITSESTVGKANPSTRAKWRFECMQQCAQKVLDTADIVREAILQQPSSSTSVNSFNLH
jgi:hypothetical protein